MGLSSEISNKDIKIWKKDNVWLTNTKSRNFKGQTKDHSFVRLRKTIKILTEIVMVVLEKSSNLSTRQIKQLI